MPLRKTPLVEGHTYHILNRGASKTPIFYDKWDYSRFLETSFYYHFLNIPLRFSLFKNLGSQERSKIIKKLNNKLVDIIAYCLMPNHFHFVLKQLEENGITIFIRRFTNSYGKYFNLKYRREGAVFQGRFKAVLIESDEQLLHVVRYIHLNPYASAVVKDIKEIADYPWSSSQDYLEKGGSGYLATEPVLSFFKSKKQFKEFIYDQADYSRKLEKIKHLALEH